LHLFLIEINGEYTQHPNAFSKEKLIKFKKKTQKAPQKEINFHHKERKFRVDAELSECDGGNPCLCALFQC
jgi:hypothetical protein